MTRVFRMRGLSLLEMLVVLSLLSMVTTILFQGYGYMFTSYQRIQLRQADETQRALANSWFRNNLAHLVAYKEGAERFQATATTITGASFSPLLSRPGIPTPVQWQLHRQGDRQELRYRERAQRIVLASWPANLNASFRFLDQYGSWTDDWDANAVNQVPAAISLAFNDSSEHSWPPVTTVVRTKYRQDKTEEEELRELGF